MRKFNSSTDWRMFGLPFLLGFSIGEQSWKDDNEIVIQSTINIYLFLLSFSFRAPMQRQKLESTEVQTPAELKIKKAKEKEVIISFEDLMTIMQEEASNKRKKIKEKKGAK